MARIGFSPAAHRALPLRLDAALAGIAVALRFIPYSHDDGTPERRLGARDGRDRCSSLAACVYLVYVLEILKFKRLAALRVRRARPEATEDDVEADVSERLETGEWEAVGR